MQRSRKGASPRISQGASEATSAGGLLVAECLDASAVLDGSGAGHNSPELGRRWSVYQLRRYRMRWLRVMRTPLSQELPQRTPRDPARRDRRRAHPRACCSCSTSTR